MNTTAANFSAPTPSPANLVSPGIRTTADALRSVPAALRSEIIKVTTIRSNFVIASIAAAISGIGGWAMAAFVTDEALTITEVFTLTTAFTAVFAAMFGILTFTSEAQHGTLAPMLTAQPSKAVVAGAKAVTAATFGAVLSIVTMSAAIAGATIGGLEAGDTSMMAGEAGRALLFTVLAATLGLGIGMIARHGAAAIGGLLVWWLVAEPVLGGLLSDGVARFLPFAAGNGLVGVSTASLSDETLALSATQNGLVFGAYALTAVALGWALLHKTETN